jgi:hypothetical protein
LASFPCVLLAESVASPSTELRSPKDATEPKFPEIGTSPIAKAAIAATLVMKKSMFERDSSDALSRDALRSPVPGTTALLKSVASSSVTDRLAVPGMKALLESVAASSVAETEPDSATDPPPEIGKSAMAKTPIAATLLKVNGKLPVEASVTASSVTLTLPVLLN